MAAEIAIEPADDDDLQHFAQRRWRDEPSRRLYRHLGATAPGGAWVVRDEGTPIAIGFAHANSDERYLCELFVEPSFRRQKIGGTIFAQLVQEADEFAYSALVDPSDHASLGFSARRGFAIHAPILRFAGAIPKEDELAVLAHSSYRFNAEPLDPVEHRYALDALDREVRGVARPDDHQLFSSIARGSAIFLDRECVGYCYAWPDGRIGPIAAASGAYVAQIFAYGLVTSVREFGASWCSAGVPGTNLRVMRAATGIGLSIDLVRCFAGSAPCPDLSRYVGYHPLLF